MLDKASIAKLLHKETNASKAELVQFFHSTFYKIGMSEEEYVSAFKSFSIDLEECLLKTKDFSINDTFLKDRPFTTSKIPIKVLKKMELDYKETQAYIQSIIDEINNQD